ncbi:MAG: thiamine pyrophosphate-binding protein [Alphaproteobacteria bacterium]
MNSAPAQPTVGSFLFDYLAAKGVTHVFGLPGDFALPAFRCLQQSKLKIITLTHEPSVGFAADAYGRVHGLGVAMVTYCVGGLNMLNPVACAYAEKSPLLVISGGPSPEDRKKDVLMHHKVRTFDTQRRIYEEVTVATAVLLDPETAPGEIVRVIDAVLEHSRPGYIELPYDMVEMPVKVPPVVNRPAPTSDPENLAAMLEDATALIGKAKQPVIIADIELHRFGLTHLALDIAHKFNIPIASTLMSKSTVAETDPLYIGVYSGPLSEEGVRSYVEQSDCLIALGAFITDVWFGFMGTAERLSRKNTIITTTEKMQIGHRSYDHVVMKEFLEALLAAPIAPRQLPALPKPVAEPQPLADSEKKEPVSMVSFFRILGLHVDENSTITSDTGDALFGAMQLRTKKSSNFLADAYYLSMGFAVPASIGIMAAKPNDRVFAIVGDGAFQMTGRYRALDRRQVRHAPHRLRPQQRRLRHAALHPRRAVQRDIAVELHQDRRPARQGQRLQGDHQRRARGCHQEIHRLGRAFPDRGHAAAQRRLRLAAPRRRGARQDPRQGKAQRLSSLHVRMCCFPRRPFYFPARFILFLLYLGL